MSNAALAVQKKNEGNEYFKAKSYDKAIELYTEAVNLDPNNHVYYSNRSAAFAGKGDWDNAAKDGMNCIRINKQFLKGYHRAARGLDGAKDYVQALKVVNDGLKLFGDNPDLRRLADDLGPKAERQERERRSGMNPIELLKEQGNDHFKKAEFEHAVQKYTEAIERGGRDLDAHPVLVSCFNNRAACHQQLGNHQKVVEDCSTVLEHDHNNVKALLRRGLAFEGLERYRIALEDIRGVLAQTPTNDIANKAQHRIGRAVRLLKQAKEQA